MTCRRTAEAPSACSAPRPCADHRALERDRSTGAWCWSDSPRFGIVGKQSQTMSASASRTTGGAAAAQARSPIRRDGEIIARRDGDRPARRSKVSVQHRPHAGRTSSRSRPTPLDNELTPHQQPRRRHHRRRPRQAARASGLRRAACRRAHLAQPPEIRCRRRPRPFHHPAAAGEAGRHADQRAVADRLPDPRAVPDQDQAIST
jgi:hypothetical protein